MHRLTLLIVSLLSTEARAACDLDSARDMRTGTGGFGVVKEGKQIVDFRWRSAFRDMAPAARVAVMKGFARSDACVNGRAREVDFYLDGKLIARSLPDGSFRAARKEFDLPDGPQVDAWLDVRTR